MSEKNSPTPQYPVAGTHSPIEIVSHKLRSQVPLMAHMKVDLVSWDGATLVLEAPLEPNLNTHGTAFGGSLYNVAAMAGWGAVHLTLMDAGHTTGVWVVKGEIEYKSPVRGVLRAVATVSAEQRACAISAGRRAASQV
jgi:thioesterase domain-containing protein